MKMYIPVLLVVLSNTVYHICSKSAPENLNVFASLAVTYLVAATACITAYFVTTKGATFSHDIHSLNWASFVLGLAIIGLESGFMWMYKVGWNISTGQIVEASLLAVVLLVVGYLFFKEAVSVTKVMGIAVCLAGLWLLNRG